MELQILQTVITEQSPLIFVLALVMIRILYRVGLFSSVQYDLRLVLLMLPSAVLIGVLLAFLKFSSDIYLVLNFIISWVLCSLLLPNDQFQPPKPAGDETDKSK